MLNRRNLRRNAPPRPMTDAEQARDFARQVAGYTPGSRNWDLVLNRVADAGCETAVIAALEESLAALRVDVTTWERSNEHD